MAADRLPVPRAFCGVDREADAARAQTQAEETQTMKK